MSDKTNSNAVFKNLGAHIKQNILTKSIGCFVAAGAALLSLIVAIVYGCGYADSVYYNAWVIVLPVLGAAAFIGLSLFGCTTPFAAAALFVFDFAGLLVYVNAVYMYLSEVFYGGINAQSLAALSPAFVVCTVIFLVCVVASNVAIYLKQNKRAETAEQGE